MNKGLFCLFLLALIPVACGKAPGLEQRVVQMVEAHNRHNVTRELTFYADDATFVMPGENPIVGKAALRDLFEADSVMNSELVFKDLGIHRDTVIVNSITEWNDYLRLSGPPEIHYAPGTKIIFSKGLIERVETAQLMDEGRKAVENDQMTWLSSAHPELVKEAQSGWLARHDARAAQMWMKLVAEWQASKSSPEK